MVDYVEGEMCVERMKDWCVLDKIDFMDVIGVMGIVV